MPGPHLFFDVSSSQLFKIAVAALFISLIVIVLHKCYIYPYFLSPLRYLPTPKEAHIPFRLLLRQWEQPMGEPFLQWIKSTPNDGIIRLPMLMGENLFLTDPKVIREYLVTKSYEFEKEPLVRDVLRLVLGEGLIVAEGNYHRFLRKSINPAFSLRKIKVLHSIFWSKAGELVDALGAQIGSDGKRADKPTAVVDMAEWATKVTLDIIGLATLGRNFRSMQDDHDPLVADYEELLRPTTGKAIYFAISTFVSGKLARSLPWRLSSQVETLTRRIQDMCRELVKNKKNNLPGEDGQTDIVAMLLASGDFTDEQIVNQVLTFFAAGHDTTSATLCWALYLLAKHPAYQAALRQEVQHHVPSPHESLPAGADLAAVLDSLPLLNAACNETIRLYPTVPSNSRVATRDTSLGGQFIPAGTRVVLSPWAINRDPALWGPRSEMFVPCRWLSVDGKTCALRAHTSAGASTTNAMLSFGHGPKNCVGQEFARAELRCLVAACVGKFEMTMENPEEEVLPLTVGTTKPKGGMRIKLTKLDGW